MYRTKSQTIPELLRDLAEVNPELPLYRFLTDGEAAIEVLTAFELHQDAMRLAARLRREAKPGDRVMLLASPGLDFIRGFYGILYAGLIATASPPLHPRRADRTGQRLEAIVQSCQPRLALVSTTHMPMAEKLGLAVMAIQGAWTEGADENSYVQVDADSTAFLQYTSGSTRQPQGVSLSHRNVLDNLRFIADRFEHGRDSVGVIWLPPYHDMGLIGGILQPLYAGFPVVLLNPLHVLQRPMRWLAAISKYRATTSGGPNFAYELCVDAITNEQRAELDLSSWRVAFCGAETVRPETWRRFTDAFSGCGFQRRAFFPCYGLAESTLMVTGAKCLQAPETITIDSVSQSGQHVASEYISCGTVDHQHVLEIIDPQTLETLPDREVGEIWLSGPSVASGYWNDVTTTEATFVRRPTSERIWLRTGDLGFLSKGGLYVTGRLKELIILAGRNHYPQDLEVAVEDADDRLQPNGACAFSVTRESEERLIIIAEVIPGIRKLATKDKQECCARIRRSLGNQFDVAAHELWLVRAGSIPRTSSGKKKRSECRILFENHHFNHEDIALGDSGVSHHSRGIHRPNTKLIRLQQRLAVLMVTVPVLGLFAAIVLAWGHGIQPLDLALLISFYLLTVLGVEAGFHRHFSHRAFQAIPLVRAVLGILGSMAAQGPLLFWVATHRRHHAYSDQAEDPHTPRPTSRGWVGTLHGLWHAHVGWLFRGDLTNPMRYAPDIFRDPLAFRIHQYYTVCVIVGLVLPALVGFLWTGSGLAMLRGFLWGGLVRILLVHHATWSVNSICHMFGHRAFETRDESRNNAWLALSSLGGSWHNNHHAFPSAAIIGFRARQLDPSGWLINALAWLGLAWDLKKPMCPNPFKQADLSTVNTENRELVS